MKLKTELSLLAIVFSPFIYLTIIWQSLPEKVPVHWSINGEIDRYGSKLELILVTALLPLLPYLIFTFASKIDPKGKLAKMGNKLQTIKILMVVLMTILSFFIINSAKNQAITNINYLVLFIGILFIVLGNYFKTIKANYFIGIRTPWTLESDTIWKETHKLGGIMWFIGGLVLIISSFVFSEKINTIFMLIVTGIISIIPIIYSYILFKKQQKIA